VRITVELHKLIIRTFSSGFDLTNNFNTLDRLEMRTFSSDLNCNNSIT